MPMHKRTHILLCSLLLSTTAMAADPTATPDPCALVPKEEVAKIIGEIKEVKTSQGLRNNKQCDYTNMEGSWLKVTVYSAEHWDMVKMAALDPAAISRLGEEAYASKRGTTREVYVRKGKLMLEVTSTVGADATQKIAAAAAKQLP